MPVNRRIRKFILVVLGAAAAAAPAGIAAQSIGGAAPAATGAQPAGAHPSRLCTVTNQRGYPNAVPPILPPPPCSALAAIRREEVFEGQEFWSDPATDARYSNAEMNAYASNGK